MRIAAFSEAFCGRVIRRSLQVGAERCSEQRVEHQGEAFLDRRKLEAGEEGWNREQLTGTTDNLCLRSRFTTSEQNGGASLLHTFGKPTLPTTHRGGVLKLAAYFLRRLPAKASKILGGLVYPRQPLFTIKVA
eukprot:scaffold109_cov252-Pinguiococcus_pyrenoidosus.AAC.7